MKKLTLISLLFCAFTIKAQQNLVLNGSFELNNSTICYHFMNSIAWNNTVDFTNSYKSSIGFINDSCITCISFPNYYWGGGAQEGNWHVNMTSKLFSGVLLHSKLSLALVSPLDYAKNYKLSFYIRKASTYPTDTLACYNPPSNYIRVGISNYDNQFGTHLITTPLGTDNWQQYSIVFNTQNAEEHITVEIGGTNDTIQYNNAYIDNFVLVETEEQPNTIFELNTNTKQLLKIVDILGKESSSNATGLLFYIYSDGTVEKKLIIE